MSIAVDTAVRSQALDSSRSFIVRAPAGSGKTGLLIQRYLKLLAQVDAPEEVVAITFTIKAAAQMRDRVLDALETSSQIGSSEFEMTTQSLAQAVNERDDELGWRLSEQPGRLRIQTIDALCLSLVRQMAWMSNLGGEMTPVEDATAHYEQASGEVFALLEGEASVWQAPISMVLRHLDNDVPRFRQMLVTMLARRDQWLRHLSSVDDDGEQLVRSLRRLTGESLQEVRAGIPVAAIDDLLRIAVRGERIKWRESLPGADYSDLTDWLGIADAVLTKDGKPRAQFSPRYGFPGAEDPDAETFKASVARVTHVLAENPGLVARLRAIRCLPSSSGNEEHWQIVRAVVQVLKIAVGFLRVVFSERGEMDFIELINAAQSALGEPENPTDLALTLDYRIRHVLVDEFQDTSHNQIELLERLTAGWEPHDGRTLFLVGDPMQSIYRFREADVGLYLDVRARGLAALRPEPLTLTANFRSAAAVVDWVNETFAAVLPATEDIATGAVTYSPSQPMADRSPGAVTVHPLFDEKLEPDSNLVAELVAEELERDASQNIAVLVRARTHLGPVLAGLKHAGIEYRGVDLHPLHTMAVLHDLLSLARSLAYPADRIAWLAVLRAPWCGLTLADLLALMRSPGERTVLQQLDDSGVTRAISADGRERCARLHKVMKRAFTDRGRYSLRQWVEQTWLALGGPVVLGDDDFEEADAFLDLLDEIDQLWAPDFDRLNTIIAERYSPGLVSRSRVEVMTIHGAKGLEFDTVIVPGLERGARSEEKKVLEWNERLALDGRRELLLAPVPAISEDPSPLYSYLRDLEKRRTRNESARLLYVATTRAKKRLHLIGAVETSNGKLKAPRGDSLLGHLWPAVSDDFERGFAASRAPSQLGLDMSRAAAFIRRIPLDWHNPFLTVADEVVYEDRDVVEFEWAGVAAKHVGTLVHRMLNLMSEQGVVAWSDDQLNTRHDRFGVELTALGVPDEELERAVKSVTDALSTALNDSTARWLLDPGHEEACSELAITGMVDGDLVNGILDRTFVDADSTRWIIDYKTGQHRGGRLDEFLDREVMRYAPQLRRYAVLMGNLDPRPIRVGLYFPVHGAWRECALP